MQFDTYEEYLLNSSDLIIIDTSTMMNTEAMEHFIKREKSLFEKYSAKIIVPNVVLGELHKHKHSSNAGKKAKADAAMQMISEHNSIFSVDEDFDPESTHSFADPELLAFLIVNRSNYSQLIITNDRSLSEDALALNGQNSNRGNTIKACYVSKDGFLSKSEKKDTAISGDSTVVNDICDFTSGNDGEKRQNWKLPVVAALSGVLSGIAIDRYLVPYVVKEKKY